MICPVLLALSVYGIVECSIGLPSGRVMVCTSAMPRTSTSALAILSITRKSAGLRRS